MSESADSDFNGEQGVVPKSRLQCTVDERDGFRHDDLSARIHVPRDSATSNVHEVINCHEPSLE